LDAFCKSQNIPPNFSLLVIAVNILFINVNDAFSVNENSIIYVPKYMPVTVINFFLSPCPPSIDIKLASAVCYLFAPNILRLSRTHVSNATVVPTQFGISKVLKWCGSLMGVAKEIRKVVLAK
jgi:hypothetical protein